MVRIKARIRLWQIRRAKRRRLNKYVRDVKRDLYASKNRPKMFYD